jgi:hypothetical protein
MNRLTDRQLGITINALDRWCQEIWRDEQEEYWELADEIYETQILFKSEYTRRIKDMINYTLEELEQQKIELESEIEKNKNKENVNISALYRSLVWVVNEIWHKKNDKEK